ncbi:MAG: winged helix-turn-helix domain-containing protein [Candidatus Bathyarchaeia archaeon]
MEIQDERILKTLTVDTLKVYNYLLKNNPSEVTLEQLSKALGLSKPTILHHIDKLKSIDLVEQTVKGYKIKEVVRISIIKGYRLQVRKLLLTWIPLTVIFIILGATSTFIIAPFELKIISIALCGLGVLISIKEAKQLM